MKPTLAAAAVTLAIAGFSGSAQAAGLGKLTVLSGLGQPLHAEVELSAARDELSSAAVRMAAPEAFRQAGMEYSPVLGTVKMALVQRRDGRPVIRITTDRPVDDPFLSILVELNWASGRLVREYTFLLDPPNLPVARQPAAPVVAPVAAPAVSQVIPGRPVAATPSPAAARAAQTAHEVRRGETLHSIASETKPQGVTLDQMLVAIFRANPQAFDGNMSRLRAGRILNIPERDTAAAVAAPEARRIVLAQAAEFRAYRQKLSQAVAAAPAPKEAPATQAAAGKLAPRVEEKPAAAAEAVDQLKVSRAEAAGKAAGGAAATTDRAAQARITALEEDLVAKEKSLKDANGRLAELEKSVRELQQLLELKNQNLARLQGQAGTPQAAAPAKAPEAAPAAQAPQPTVSAPPPVAAKPEAAKPEAAKPAAPQREEPGFLSGLFGGPAGWGLGAVILALLGLLGYRLRRRSAEPGAAVTAGATTAPVAQASFGAAGGQSVDTTSSSVQTDFSQSGLSSIDTDEGVDPVAEADVYMAYGRDAQAEEILLDALKSEPTRHAIHVKLLEIYAQRKDVKRFDALATELYAATGGKGPEWDKAAAMGRKLDPTNALFGAAAPAPAEETRFTEKTIVVSSPDKLRDTWTMPGDAGQIAAAVSGDREDKTVILDRSPLADAGAAPLDLAQPAATATPAPVADVDFDLGLDFSATLTTPRPAEALAAEKTVVLEPGAGAGGKPSIDLPLDAATKTQQLAAIDLDLEPGAARPQAPDASIDLEATDIGGNIIDFELDQAPVKSAPAAQVVDLEKTDIGADVMQFVEGERAGAPTAPVVDLEKTDIGGGVLDFNFKLDEANNAAPAGEPAAPAAPRLGLSGINLDLSAPPADAGAEEISEVATKIELAKAYEEMGDKEGARELLDEVLKEGNASEQQRAREMLSRLG